MNILLIISLLIGFILRLISLNQSLWLDEAVQVWASSSFTVKNLLIRYMPGDFNPPLYHLLMKGWLKFFSQSEALIRIPSLLFGLGSIYLFYQVIALQKEKKAWFVSLLLLATSPLHVYYSQEARMYILACFSFLLAFWRFLVFAKKTNIVNAVWLGLSFLLMGFSHFLTLFTLPVFFLWGVWQERKKGKKDWLVFFLPFIILILGYLAYSPLLCRQIKTGLGWQKSFPVWKQTVGSFTFKAAALLPIKFIIGRISITPGWLYAFVAGALVFVYWSLAFLGVKDNFNLVKSGKRKKLKIKDQGQFLIFLLLVFPPVLGFVLGFKVSVFSYFRFLFILPLFYLLIGRGLAKSKKLFGFLSVFLIGVNLICSGVYLFNPDFHREDWRGMVVWLHSQNRYFNAPLIIAPQIEKPFLHYDQSETRIIGVEKVKEPVIYLVSYGLPIFDPSDKIRNSLRKKGYKMKKGESFNKVGIEVWRE